MFDYKAIVDLVTNNTATWAGFVAIAIFVAALVFLIPKNKKLILTERIVLVVASFAILFVPLILDAINPDWVDFNVKNTLFGGANTLVTIMLAGIALVLVLGIFFEKSYIIQGLYGIIVSLCMPFSLMELVFPGWTKADSLAGIFTNDSDIVFLLIYATIFFITLWMMRADLFKLRLTSAWHVFGGLTLGVSSAFFLIRSGIVSGSATVNKLIHLFDNPKGTPVDWKIIGAFVLAVVVLVVIMLIAAAVSTFMHKYVEKNDEKLLVSSSVGGLVTRIVGRVASIATCIALTLVISTALQPYTIDKYALCVGMPKALLCLIPIAVYLVMLLATELVADVFDVKHDLAKHDEDARVEAAEEAAAQNI